MIGLSDNNRKSKTMINDHSVSRLDMIIMKISTLVRGKNWIYKADAVINN